MTASVKTSAVLTSKAGLGFMHLHCHAMEGRELNPYEQQLLAVFESCVQDESGSLDAQGLEHLCEKLQLDEQGLHVQLIKCLIGSHSSNKTVTFPEFRDGLLTLLENQGEQTTRREGGDRGSPEREVSPKFVFGKKKYGRRSRPESTDQDLSLDQEESLDDSDLEIFVPLEDKNKEITMRSVPDATLEEVESKRKRKISSPHSPANKNAPNLPRNQSGMSDVSESGWQTSTEVNEICGESGTPSLGHVGENEEECLRATWESLGVGKDGYLDRGEVALVCECIGMAKVAEEVVQQLFEKLEVDRDGRISFEEFLLLFRSGGSWVQPNIVPQPKSSPARIVTDTSKQRTTLGSSDQDSQFLALDPNSAGYVSAEVILEMWEAAGIPGPSQLLQDLGFSESQRLSIAELAAVLEEELRSLVEEKRNEEAAGSNVHTYSPHETLLQATLALYQTEVRCLKLSLEHMGAERDKLRADLMDANQRASLLAQEVDDHHARLEKSSQLQVKLLEQRHAEQLKDLSEQLGSDREQLAVQNMSLEKQVAGLQEEETRLRIQVSTLQSENEVLDKENHSLTEQLAKSEETRTQLQKELESLAGLQQRLSELEGSHDREKMLPLLERINELQAENTGLRDRNDELTMEVESLTSKLASLKTKKSPPHEPAEFTNTSEGGGIPVVMSATKRRGNSPLVLATEDSSEEESPRLGKMRRCCDGASGDSQDVSLETVNMEGLQIHPLVPGESGVETDLEIDDYAESSYTVCEAERSELEERLNRVPEQDSNKPNSSEDMKQDEDSFTQVFQAVPAQIVQGSDSDSSLQDRYQRKDLPDGASAARSASFALLSALMPSSVNGVISSDHLENAKDVEQLEKHCRDLKSQLDIVKVEIVKILSEKKACSKENCALKNHISDLKNRLPTDVSSEEDSESVGKESVLQSNSSTPEKKVDGEGCDKSDSVPSLKELSERLKQQEEKHLKEMTTMRDRCSELENSLELLRQEYEKCEDYWANKLEEERHLYDQEQKLSDEKFAELVSKIKEYEEMLGGQDDDRSDDSDRLSTIEERASLEKQFTDLEEEFEEYRQRVEIEQSERDEELEQLKEQVKSLEQHKEHTDNKLNVAVQVTDLENGSWESDRTFVVELDSARKTIRNENEHRKHHRTSNENAAGLVNGHSNLRYKVTHSSRSSSPSTYSDNAELRAELLRLHNLKDQLEEECQVLRQQKEAIVQEVLDVQTGKTHQNGSIGMTFPFPPQWASAATKVGSQACRIDLNVLQAMNARLRQQEQQCRNLQLTVKQQQKQHENILKCTWQKHKEEINSLHSMLAMSQEKLNQQSAICKEQLDRLTNADILVKELFVENAYLTSTVQRMEQRCQVLVQMTADSSSV